MNENLDYLFGEKKTETDKAPTERLSTEEYAAKKESERQAVYDLADDTAKAVATSGAAFQNYLNTLSRFELYSPTNTLLIFAQKPDATRLRDYDSWVTAETPVKKGEVGISIIERKDYKREDGTTGYNLNPKKVFDISQTSAKPEPVKQQNIKMLCQALIKNSPAKIVLVDEIPDVSAKTFGAEYDAEGDQIEIEKGLDGESIFRCLSQEVVYANLLNIEPEKFGCRNTTFVAYAASYTLCQKYGIDTKDYDFSNIPEHFQRIDDKALRAELGAIRDTVADLTGAINKSLEQQKAARKQEAR